jgi:phosphate transport system permease protein
MALLDNQLKNSSDSKNSVGWFRSGEPYIWLNAAAVSVSLIAVVGIIALLAVRGFGHFWPSDVTLAEYGMSDSYTSLMGELVEQVEVSGEQLREAGFTLRGDQPFYSRSLYKQGNREIGGNDFVWVIDQQLNDVSFPQDAMTVERLEWGNFYGFLRSVSVGGQQSTLLDVSGAELWQKFEEQIERITDVRVDIHRLEKTEIGAINHQMERLRRQESLLRLEENWSAQYESEFALAREELNAQYKVLQAQLAELYLSVTGINYTAETSDGTVVTMPVAKVVRVYQPNSMDLLDKSKVYAQRLWEFLSAEPREANTEGGVFPAIFGTVMMVLLMSVMVTPFGVVAAVYLREYARQGFLTRVIRIAVNNLAGVPSIVYGVFGLGFFVYFLGSEVDQLFFPEVLPSPTFGTPGLMWASLTLALLTLPVVIVATEEGLARIPKSLREGSLALGATKAETLWRVVLPMASPAMMTGLILAVARAAGEVAPLMLVGVVKLAPSLPVDGNYPFVHLDQKFMHLGFHIYDVGFQSPNVEAARPLVYATAFLLVALIALLNFTAVMMRNRLRERYKSLDS